MSLTSFLRNEDVKERFAHEFPMPKFNMVGELKAQPKTNHYSMVGTAFDYLMRFYLKKINPSAITKEWVAEFAVDLTSLIGDKKLSKKTSDILQNAKKSYIEYLKNGEMDEEIIKSCLHLAQLDPIYRSGFIDKNIGIIDSNDVDDLKKLIKLIDEKKFLSKHCILNPTFKASKLVGGADMDILLDDTLIDIKTTKFLELRRDNFNQIIGYYILFLIGGINGARKNTEINFIGIYYSRHGLLYKILINDVIKHCDLQKFIKWFKKRAKQEFGGKK